MKSSQGAPDTLPTSVGQRGFVACLPTDSHKPPRLNWGFAHVLFPAFWYIYPYVLGKIALCCPLEWIQKGYKL